MDGEIDALLGLFDQVSVGGLPGQVFGCATGFFQGLVDRLPIGTGELRMIHS